MTPNEQILDILKNLARDNGSSVLSLNLVYNMLIESGLYSSTENISKALKRLQASGKIKSASFGVSIEILGIEELPKKPRSRVQTTKEYVQKTL